MRTTATVSSALLALTLLGAACADPSFDPGDDAELGDEGVGDDSADPQPQDAFPGQFTVLGTIQPGQTLSGYSETNFRAAFRFTVNAGTNLVATAHGASSGYDPVLWVVTPSLQILAFNDDISSTNVDCRVTFTVPKTGTYFLVFRDYDKHAGWADIGLSYLASVPPPIQ